VKRTCKQCGVEKRLGSFYRWRKHQPARMRICKACHCANVRENRVLKIEHYRAYNRIRARLPHNVARRRAYERTERGAEIKRRCARVRMRWIRMMARQG
jgi:hypothetical protein